MTIPFKAVAVDMDGTFLDENREYNHQEFDKLLTKLEQRKINFIISSGRPYARLQKDFPEFTQRLDFVTTNGARIIVNGQEAAISAMKKEDAVRLINMVHDNYGKMATVIFYRNSAYINQDAPEEAKKFLMYFTGNCIEIKDWEQLPDEPIIQITFHRDSNVAHKIEKDFNKIYGQKISAFASADMAIDVNAYGVNKGTGLEKLLREIDVTPDELIAFGDSDNDLAMLDLAKYSYAMANGMDIAKQHAKFIAPRNSENGVFRVLNKYLAK